MFHETVEARKSDEERVVYDGPPFANGPPHYGHLLAGHAKDMISPYQTMRGTQGRATIRLDLARAARPT
ncbi:class I tRNA ligase family protein [Streptomyces hygroscopicus]|uniref:class I tRNA ligase family protein n=1 Tax=Streptomyces hygroscopicus TaxID=1912 RepID=UPI003D7672BA